VKLPRRNKFAAKERGAADRKGDCAMQFTVGLKTDGRTDHTVVDAEDALIAALKVKMQRPQAEILYVRRANKRGDARHPAHALKKER
jgi:hypothetical protein